MSCTKSSEIHFHGRISVECNNAPVSNAAITIHRYYDDAQHQGQTVGFVNTQSDGTYSLITDVEQKCSFMNYGLTIHADATANYQEINAHFYSDDEYGDDIITNYIAKFEKDFFFHIKNSNPISSNDNLNYLFVDRGNNYSANDTLVVNLTGISIDTTIQMSYFILENIYYSFTKNGLTTLDSQEIHHSDCSDTLNLDILY